MSRTPRAWPRQDGGGAASAPTSRSPSAPPSRVGARPPSARVRPPSRPPLCGWTTGRHRAEAPRAARATAPEARGAARSARLHCAGAGRPTPQDLSRCSGPVAARSSVARSSSPPRHPRSCDPAPKARSPESVASRSDPGPTGTPLPDPPRSDEQQPAPWFASATHGPPAYPLRNSPGILNPSPSPGNRMTDLKLEQAISQDSKLRQSANAQVVRDLRTLREAAIILDANKHTAECRRLVAVVRELVADPKRAIETSSDTDEDKAEVLTETSRQETAALKNPAQ